MDTNQLTKEEILLLTRYYLDDFRRSEIFKRSADKFAREAKIDETQPLVGTLWEYNELCWKECRDLDYWTYFCDKKLKTLRGNTFQSNALTNTTTNQQHLSVDRSGIEVFNFPSVIFGSSRDYLLILKQYIDNYILRDVYKTLFVKEEIDAKKQDVGSSSKKRRVCSDENVKIER